MNNTVIIPSSPQVVAPNGSLDDDNVSQGSESDRTPEAMDPCAGISYDEMENCFHRLHKSISEAVENGLPVLVPSTPSAAVDAFVNEKDVGNCANLMSTVICALIGGLEDAKSDLAYLHDKDLEFLGISIDRSKHKSSGQFLNLLHTKDNMALLSSGRKIPSLIKPKNNLVDDKKSASTAQADAEKKAMKSLVATTGCKSDDVVGFRNNILQHFGIPLSVYVAFDVETSVKQKIDKIKVNLDHASDLAIVGPLIACASKAKEKDVIKYCTIARLFSSSDAKVPSVLIRHFLYRIADVCSMIPNSAVTVALTKEEEIEGATENITFVSRLNMTGMEVPINDMISRFKDASGYDDPYSACIDAVNTAALAYRNSKYEEKLKKIRVVADTKLARDFAKRMHSKNTGGMVALDFSDEPLSTASAVVRSTAEGSNSKQKAVDSVIKDDSSALSPISEISNREAIGDSPDEAAAIIAHFGAEAAFYLNSLGVSRSFSYIAYSKAKSTVGGKFPITAPTLIMDAIAHMLDAIKKPDEKKAAVIALMSVTMTSSVYFHLAIIFAEVMRLPGVAIGALLITNAIDPPAPELVSKKLKSDLRFSFGQKGVLNISSLISCWTTIGTDDVYGRMRDISNSVIVRNSEVVASSGIVKLTGNSVFAPKVVSKFAGDSLDSLVAKLSNVILISFNELPTIHAAASAVNAAIGKSEDKNIKGASKTHKVLGVNRVYKMVDVAVRDSYNEGNPIKMKDAMPIIMSAVSAVASCVAPVPSTALSRVSQEIAVENYVNSGDQRRDTSRISAQWFDAVAHAMKAQNPDSFESAVAMIPAPKLSLTMKASPK